jgi:hypothetical protein
VPSLDDGPGVGPVIALTFRATELPYCTARAVFTDAGYTGAEKRLVLEDCDVDWNIAVRRRIIKVLPERLRHSAEAMERALSQVRARVE